MAKKIAMISDHASPLAALGGIDNGGQNVYVAELSCHLADLGYEVDVFTRWDDLRLPKVVEWREKIRIVHIKAGPVNYVRKEKIYPYMKEFSRNILGFMKSGEYSIAHANFWLSGIAAREIKRKTGMPFVVTFHALGKIRRQFQGRADKFPKEREGVEDEIVKTSDAIIAESPQDREDLIRYYSAPEEKIIIIPCGANMHYFHPEDKLLARKILDLSKTRKIILSVGRVVPRKGTEDILTSLKILKEKYGISAALIVVGGDSDEPDPVKTPEIGRLQNIARQKGVWERVSFAGRKSQEELKYYYNAADVFVSTPWYEPFGMTPVEAMACGTPVIGSNVGGIKYTVVDGKTGFVVPAKNPAFLAVKLNELLSNKKLCRYFKEKSLERVRDSFTWSQVANSIANLYERVIAKNLSCEQIYTEKIFIFNHSFERVMRIMQSAKESLRIPVLNAAGAISKALESGGKILVCGNGGSAAESQHLASEMMGRFIYKDRKALPVLALTADSSFLTAWTNDFNYDNVFARQVEALGKAGDILIVISASGKSINIIRALMAAKEKRMITIGILGIAPGKTLDLVNIPLSVSCHNVQQIQEVHLHLIHAICEMVEKDVVLKGFEEERPIFFKRRNKNEQLKE